MKKSEWRVFNNTPCIDIDGISSYDPPTEHLGIEAIIVVLKYRKLLDGLSPVLTTEPKTKPGRNAVNISFGLTSIIHRNNPLFGYRFGISLDDTSGAAKEMIAEILRLDPSVRELLARGLSVDTSASAYWHHLLREMNIWFWAADDQKQPIALAPSTTAAILSILVAELPMPRRSGVSLLAPQKIVSPQSATLRAGLRLTRRDRWRDAQNCIDYLEGMGAMKLVEAIKTTSAS